MKTKALVFGVVIFIVSILTSVCIFAGDKEKYSFYVPSSNEEIYGTWVNPEYSGLRDFFPRIVNYKWGYYEVFCPIEPTHACESGTMTLVDKWTDPEGNVWYKQYWRANLGGSGFEIDRISKDGTVLEFVFSSTEFPTEEDIVKKNDAKAYRIYYRQ